MYLKSTLEEIKRKSSSSKPLREVDRPIPQSVYEMLLPRQGTEGSQRYRISLLRHLMSDIILSRRVLYSPFGSDFLFCDITLK